MKFEIYSTEEYKARPERKRVYMESYIIGDNKPTVLICPGGAYGWVSDFNEGKPFADKLNKRGYNAFVLFYSVGKGNALYPNPLKDLARAIEFIKNNADKFNINSESLALLGSSAGGHLVSLFATEYQKYETDISLKPSALILTYPVTDMDKYGHKLSKKNFLGAFAGKKKIESANVYMHITENYPPTFLWHNKDDKSVPYQNSLLLKEALDKNKVPNKFLLFNEGGHGVGLAEGKEADGWIDKAIDFLDENT